MPALAETRPRVAWRVPLALFLLALAVRVVVAAGHPDPGYPDSAYYVDVARRLAAGHGFSVDFLWTFIEVGGRIPANPVLPVPSNPHWAPLASIVQVPFISLFGTGIWASLAPFLLIGSLAAPLTWAIARDMGAVPAVQVGAGLLAALPGLATPFTAQTDNPALTMVLGGAACWMAARGLRGDGRAFAMSGLFVGLATLARTDGILLAAAPAAAFAWDRWRRRRRGARDRPAAAISWRAGVACAGLFLAVTGPWWIRQLVVFGSISPSSGAGILWLTSFGQLNSVTADRSLAAFLAQPPGELLGSRLLAFGQALEVFAVLVCSIALAPFVLVGVWRRRSQDLGPAYVAAGFLLAVAVLLFAIHVPNGMFLHASIAFAPYAYILAAEGLVAAGELLARRAHATDAARAGWACVAAGVVVAAAAAAFASTTVHAAWDATLSDRLAVASALDGAGAPPSDRLMTIDAAGYEYLTGRGGIVSPDDPLPVIEQAARAYGVRWLVLERDGDVPALAAVLDGGARPSWIGPPVFAIPGGTGTPLSPGTARIALLPVCVAPSDTRCGTGSGS